MLVVGVGLGLIASQVTNVNLASAGPEKTSETGALQGTAQNLGSALGTALIGSLLLSVLTTTFDHRVKDDRSLPFAPRHEVRAKTDRGLAFLPAPVAGGALREKEVGDGDGQPPRSRLLALPGRRAEDRRRRGGDDRPCWGLAVTRRLPSAPLRGPPVEEVGA